MAVDTQNRSPAAEDPDSGLGFLVVVGLGHGSDLWGCRVGGCRSSLLAGQLANRVAWRVAKRLWPRLPGQMLREPAAASGSRVYATLFATLMANLTVTHHRGNLHNGDTQPPA